MTRRDNLAPNLPWRSLLDEAPPLERFYAELALGPAPEEPEAFVEAVLARMELPSITREFLRHQGAGRLLVYRKLIRNNLREAVLVAIPRAAARMEDAFFRELAAYLDGPGPRSRFLRDITGEFLIRLERERPSDIPAYVLELARLEAARIEVAAEPEEPAETVELDLDAGLVFARACRLLHFTHAVHRLPDDDRDRSLPDRVDTALMVYRDQGHQVRYLALSPLAGRITRRLLDGQPLGKAVQTASREQEVELNQRVLSGAARVLADMADRGILLGAVPAEAAQG